MSMTGLNWFGGEGGLGVIGARSFPFPHGVGPCLPTEKFSSESEAALASTTGSLLGAFVTNFFEAFSVLSGVLFLPSSSHIAGFLLFLVLTVAGLKTDFECERSRGDG